MLDLDAAPSVAQVFGDKPTVTMMRLFFAAEKAATVKQFARYGLFNPAGPHEIHELVLVKRPVAVRLLLVGIENFRRRSEDREMNVVDVADSFSEISQIILLGETGELRDVVETHINKPLHAGFPQPRKEGLGGFFREAYGENLHDAALLVMDGPGAARAVASSGA